MEIKNVNLVKVDADCDFPPTNFGKSDISFNDGWVIIFGSDKIVMTPTCRIRSVIIEKNKDTIIR